MSHTLHFIYKKKKIKQTAVFYCWTTGSSDSHSNSCNNTHKAGQEIKDMSHKLIEHDCK